MIKQLFLLLLLSSIVYLPIFAQDDSTAYEIQRLKVNALLAERSAKFGQYDQSLNERTGIFGFQTKRDIRNSNEILRMIALTDNEIFTELKILLDYKDLQVEQIKINNNNSAERILNYRKTIKDLQTQNEDLNNRFIKTEGVIGIAYLFMTLFLIGSAILAYFLNIYRKKLKRYEKATF